MRDPDETLSGSTWDVEQLLSDALRPVEVAVGLEERLLREVLGVVVVAAAVVAVAVDVA